MGPTNFLTTYLHLHRLGSVFESSGIGSQYAKDSIQSRVVIGDLIKPPDLLAGLSMSQTNVLSHGMTI
jgi:hypothetical protein